jgi:hypothetical protein
MLYNSKVAGPQAPSLKRGRGPGPSSKNAIIPGPMTPKGSGPGSQDALGYPYLGGACLVYSRTRVSYVLPPDLVRASSIGHWAAQRDALDCPTARVSSVRMFARPYAGARAIWRAMNIDLARNLIINIGPRIVEV